MQRSIMDMALMIWAAIQHAADLQKPFDWSRGSW